MTSNMSEAWREFANSALCSLVRGANKTVSSRDVKDVAVAVAGLADAMVVEYEARQPKVKECISRWSVEGSIESTQGECEFKDIPQGGKFWWVRTEYRRVRQVRTSMRSLGNVVEADLQERWAMNLGDGTIVAFAPDNKVTPCVRNDNADRD